MLLYISVYHKFSGKFPKRAKISRASTTITFIVIVLARDTLACFGKVAGK